MSVKMEFGDFKKLAKQYDDLANSKIPEFIESVSKELAARLLGLVIPRTPVGTVPKNIPESAQEYWQGYKGGTLRRGWTAGTKQGARAYAQTLPVTRKGDTFEIDVINSIEYAPYVEYGHRQTPGRYVPALGVTLKKSYVPGKYMLTLSVKELETQAPQVIERKIKEFLGEVFS